MGTELQLRKSELFRMLDYRPHPGQERVHRSHAQRRVLACGSRFGKSTCAAMECIAGLIEPRDSTLAWLIGPTYDLTDRIFKRVVHALHSRFGHRIREYHPREHRIVVTNLGGGSSELRAKSADRPESLLGESLTFLVVDEAASVRERVWDECLAPRLIDRDGWALIVGTPRGPGWFYDQFERGGVDAAYECWQAPTSQNPFVPSAVIEAERARLTPAQFAQQYEAVFIGVRRKACKLCGGPREDVEGRVTAPVGEHKDDFIPRCPSCGMFVDADGRCIVKRHNEWFAEFQVDRPWTERGSMTMYSWHTDGKDLHNWK